MQTLNSLNSNRKPVTFNDQVNKAETYLALQAVQSQWSFQSFDTLPEEKLVASLASLPQNATYWRSRWIKACNIGKKGCWLNILFYCELGYSGILRFLVHYFLKNLHYFQILRH